MLYELETAAEVKQLKKRWNEEHFLEITEALVNCAGIPTIGCASMYQRGEVSYLDLRGASILKFVMDARFSNVDLSFCKNVGIGGANHTKLSDCRLVNVNFSECVVAVDAINCDFSKCVFHDLFGTYENCLFIDAKFSRVSSVNVSFVRCDFRGANMRMVHLKNSTFNNCLWDDCKLGFGSFCGSTFIGTMPTPEQLGDFLMEDVVVQLD